MPVTTTWRSGDEEEKESGTGASTIRRCGCGLGGPPPPPGHSYGVGEGTRKAATHSRVGGEPLPDYDQTATVTPTATTTTQCVLSCSRAYLSTLSLSCLPHCRIRGAAAMGEEGGSLPRTGYGGGTTTRRMVATTTVARTGREEDMFSSRPVVHCRRKYVGCNCTCLFVVSHMLANGYLFVVSHMLAMAEVQRRGDGTRNIDRRD